MVADADSLTKNQVTISLSLDPIGDLGALGHDWRALESRADHSFFQSWSWIGAWLELLPREVIPLAARFTCAGQTVGLGILVERHTRRYGLWRTVAYALNETGERALDSIFIEDNGWLMDRSFAAAILASAPQLLTEVLPQRRHEIVLSGVTGEYLAAPGAGLATSIRMRRASFILDLTGPGIARFGKNTRYQIRKAMRDYGALGPLEAIAATSAGEAREYLGALSRLHQTHWRARGKPGAFAEPFFVAFHDRLIASAFERGEIELVRIRAGKHEIGFLYNFVHHGRVYAYQSGFDYALLPRGHPGLLCHWFAIERHRAMGREAYDFLAGDNQLKRNLSSATAELFWIVWRRDRPWLRWRRGLGTALTAGRPVTLGRSGDKRTSARLPANRR
jgi:CelD/BcsL family acetyltransferase involved in cellulose biosynthesis